MYRDPLSDFREVLYDLLKENMSQVVISKMRTVLDALLEAQARRVEYIKNQAAWIDGLRAGALSRGARFLVAHEPPPAPEARESGWSGWSTLHYTCVGQILEVDYDRASDPAADAGDGIPLIVHEETGVSLHFPFYVLIPMDDVCESLKYG